MNNKSFYLLAAILVVATIAFWAFMFQGTSDSAVEETAAVQNEVTEINNEEITLTMYHGEGCMCCERWADYLKDQGVTVEDKLLDDPHSIKNENNIPPRLRSCHTAIVDGYVVEGHVPLEDIRRMLSEQPDAIGISVPGMPPNAPGMDQPVDREYQVVLFDEADLSVYAIHN